VSRGYTVVVERDPESGWLVGEVVGLPGCYTQAPDLPALERNIGAYLAVTGSAEAASEFVGTWRVEVTA
jgi:predicted RNase H-like HicB family nuclease